jgi:hypothetical protein
MDLGEEASERRINAGGWRGSNMTRIFSVYRGPTYHLLRDPPGIGKGYSDLIYPVGRNDTISMHTHQGEGKMFSTHVLIGFLSIGF